MSAKLKIAELNKRAKELNAEIKSLTEDALKEVAAELFEAHPKLKSFRMVAYTPAFNDGDPCKFRFREEPEQINGLDEGETNDEVTEADWENGETWDRETRKMVSTGNPPGWIYLAQEAITEAFSIFSEAQMEATFGSSFSLDFKRHGSRVVLKVDKSYDCGY